MVNRRVIALDNITSNNNKYKKLSDGTVIGTNILNDLFKYAELNLKKKYKIDINNWIIHTTSINNNTQEIDDDKLRNIIKYKYHENQNLLQIKRENNNIKLNQCLCTSTRLLAIRNLKQIYYDFFYLKKLLLRSTTIKFE